VAQPLNKLAVRAPHRPSPPGPNRALPSSFVDERYESELTRAATVLDGVDRALERLSEGTYGQCETCGAPVLDADLERDPTRRMCEQHLTLA
jgi:RNA polymerase-binding transcription factor DksA